VRAPPWWLWVVLLGVVLGGLILSDIMRSQYYKGVADSAATEAVRQTTQIEETAVLVDSLTTELREVEEVVRVQSALDFARMNELRLTQIRSSQRADSLAVELEARLDSTQVQQLRMLVSSHRAELSAVQEALAIEREGRQREALRADRASNVVLQLEVQVARLEERDSTRLVEIEALREASGGIGFSFDVPWITGAGGVVAGFLLANWLHDTP
jgi:hypothetical protein